MHLRSQRLAIGAILVRKVALYCASHPILEGHDGGCLGSLLLLFLGTSLLRIHTCTSRDDGVVHNNFGINRSNWLNIWIFFKCTTKQAKSRQKILDKMEADGLGGDDDDALTVTGFIWLRMSRVVEVVIMLLATQ